MSTIMKIYFKTDRLPDETRGLEIFEADGNTLLVGISRTGELTYGPNYTPDEAAQRFWEGVRRLAASQWTGMPR